MPYSGIGEKQMWNSKNFDQAVKRLPALYSTEDVPAEDKKIAMHLFIGGSDWYICEGDKKEGVLFGFACLNGDWGFAEWGYASIEELKALRETMKGRDAKTGEELKMGYAEVDYDLHWKPCRFADIPEVLANVYDGVAPKPSKEFKGSAKDFLKECMGEEGYKLVTNSGLLIEEPDGSLRAPIKTPLQEGSTAWNFAKAEGMI